MSAELPNSIEELRSFEAEQVREREARVGHLRSIFEGAIRYNEMLLDHPGWTDAQCVTFARRWHLVAVKQFAERGPDKPGEPSGWNRGIPYCRNDHTKANL